MGFEHIIKTQCVPSEQVLHILRVKQRNGQCSASASVAAIDAVKVATTARTKQRRIFCEDVIVLVKINIKGKV